MGIIRMEEGKIKVHVRQANSETFEVECAPNTNIADFKALCAEK